VKYFFDNCISPKILQILHLAGAADGETGHELVHISNADGFSRDDADLVWMPKVATQGWIVVTTDNRIRSKPHERELLQSTQLRAVFVAEGVAQLRRWEQAEWFLGKWRKIAAATERCAAGETFQVRMNGKVESLSGNR
jgi:hypothetical protein